MASDNMDWDTMRVFRIVAELGSMNSAAASIGDSPPTVSRKIDELESALGVKLFTRTPRGVQLTEQGDIAYRHSKSMSEAAQNLRDEIAKSDMPVEGRIRLACGDGIGPYWLAKRMKSFHVENPKIQLSLTITEKAPELLDVDADIAIEYVEPKRNDVIARRLGIMHYTTFASQDYIDTHSMPTSLFEYHKHRCILYEGYVNQVERWAPKVEELRKMISYALVTNSASVMVEYCAAGGGIALLPSFFTEVDPRLVPLDLPEVAPLQFWLTYTERVRRLPHGQVVIDWIRSQFDPRYAPWFSDEFFAPQKWNAKAEEALSL